MTRRFGPSARHPHAHRDLLAVGRILDQGLIDAAVLSLFSPDRSPVDLDDPNLVSGLSEEERVRLLNLLGLDAGTRESTKGYAASKTDKVAHAWIAEQLRKLLPGSLVAGEESPDHEWTAALAAREGECLWNLDAIDGSRPLEIAGYGFSSNVILYQVRAGVFVPILQVVVNSSGLMLGWAEECRAADCFAPTRVAVAQLRHADPGTGLPMMIELTEPQLPLSKVVRDTVGVVAATYDARMSIAGVLDDPIGRWTVVTLGGAPVLPQLLVGHLEAVLIPTPQTRHDASPLLPLASGMGLFFVDLETDQRYTDDEIRKFFYGLVRPHGDDPTQPSYTPVPALVVARELAVAQQIATAWRWRGRGRGLRIV